VNRVLTVPKRNIAKQQVFCCGAAKAVQDNWDVLRPRPRAGTVVRKVAFVAADGFQHGAFQHTLRTPAVFAGVGVHTGAYTRASVHPAPVDAGIVFVRTDVVDRDNRIPVSGEAVCKTQLGTVIGNADGVTLSTIEHLMAALAMLGVDNAVVEVDGP
jgi:hypothetical protein